MQHMCLVCTVVVSAHLHHSCCSTFECVIVGGLWHKRVAIWVEDNTFKPILLKCTCLLLALPPLPPACHHSTHTHTTANNNACHVSNMRLFVFPRSYTTWVYKTQKPLEIAWSHFLVLLFDGPTNCSNNSARVHKNLSNLPKGTQANTQVQTG